MNLTDLASFVRVAELGTITAAAQEEGVPKSTISRRIARLEDALGVELLRRSARSFTLSDDGRTLHARSIGALRELSEVELALTDLADEPRGRLVVTAPHDFGRTRVVVDLLCEYRRRHPGVSIEARLENRLTDLVAEGIDVGLRLHTGEIPGDPGLMVRSLGQFSGGVFASPAYIKRRGLPREPNDLCEHDLAMHRAVVGRGLRFVSSGGEIQNVDAEQAVLESNDFGLLQGVVEAGGAIAVLPRLFVGDLERSGAIVRLLPDWTMPGGRLSLVWPASRHLSPRVRAFIDLAAERLS